MYPYCKVRRFIDQKFRSFDIFSSKVSENSSKWCGAYYREAPVWAPALIDEKPFSCLYHESNVTLFSSEVSSYAEKTSLIPVCAIFNQMFIFHQMLALQKLWKVFFISSKKLFLFSRYSIFCIFVFPPFFPCQPLL